MELLQLKYFLSAAKTENFSATANLFFVPPSSVSASIKKLEKELGVNLFDRTANKIKLNGYGKIFFDAVEKSEQLLKKAKSDIYDLSKSPFGEMKLLILTNRQKVTNVISEFKSKYPNISFNISHHGEVSRDTVSKYDIIVTEQNISSDNFSKKFWIREEIFVAMHKDHSLAKNNVISAENLKNEKFICMQKGSSIRNCADAFFQKKHINPEIIIECEDPQYVRSYLNIGLGITFYPFVSWQKQIDDNIRLLKIDEGLFRDTYIYINKASANFVNLFADCLTDSTK